MHAEPKPISKILGDEYVIPDFQRPYSWGTEHCETLWSDLTEFYESHKVPGDNDQYFLGSIVVHPENGKFIVIDGQQRLTTLLLLIKAFFKHASDNQGLEDCLFIRDQLSGKLTEDLRIYSNVLNEDQEDLRNIIKGNEPDKNNKRNIATNFRLFNDKIYDWINAPHNSEQVRSLIKTLLNKFVLLPIQCDSEDDALMIFETINNRGLSLSDSDIFKAKLYHNLPKEKQKSFTDDWSKLDVPNRLFRIYMHILRADKEDIGKEKALRSFYTQEEFSDPAKVMACLKKINAIEEGSFFHDDEESSKWAISTSLVAILKTYPNYYWNYPLYVFLYKYGNYDAENGYNLPVKYLNNYNILCEKTVKYYFIKGVVHNSVNVVRDTTYSVCAKIAKDQDYLAEYESAITDKDKEVMIAHISENSLTRYRRGIFFLASYLNEKQDKSAFAKLMGQKNDLEHIISKKWYNCDGWNEKLFEQHENDLGNIMPLERKLNIVASNSFLKSKKKHYKNSLIQDAKDIANNPDDSWTPEKVEEMTFIKRQRLHHFFGLTPLKLDRRNNRTLF